MSLRQKITEAWYRDQSWVRTLVPLSKLYELGLNRRCQKAQAKKRSLPVPVVVVGNITVGGTGKTPLIIHLCQKLTDRGFSVGVVSRGYLGRGARSSRSNRYPCQVNSHDSPDKVGDEPLMICRESGVTIVIDPDRYAAARHLLDIQKVDVILSDDGMQHFGLPRDMEILVVDGSRELGNELLLPAGPLREPVERLRTVDFCLVNGNTDTVVKSDALKCVISGHFKLTARSWVQVSTDRRVNLDEFAANHLASTKERAVRNIKAVAGIGNPQRFFNTLNELGINAEPYPLDDHQAITPALLDSLETQNIEEVEKNSTQILMTMKDAVKCREFAADNCWALDVGLEIDALLEQKILSSIQSLIEARTAAH